MAARDGMANLITRLRAMTNAGTAEYTVSGVSYFSDNHLQDLLDAHCVLVENQPLTWLPDTITGGSIRYHRAAIGYRDLEEAESGTVQWNVKDSTGVIQGTAGYTKDYLAGLVRFAADQAGSAYHATARSYDLNAAAAEVWRRRAASMADWYSFSDAGQKFERQQAYKQALEMADRLSAQRGANRPRVSPFLRTDLTRSN